jgi:hypothetical protein
MIDFLSVLIYFCKSIYFSKINLIPLWAGFIINELLSMIRLDSVLILIFSFKLSILFLIFLSKRVKIYGLIFASWGLILLRDLNFLITFNSYYVSDDNFRLSLLTLDWIFLLIDGYFIIFCWLWPIGVVESYKMIFAYKGIFSVN